MQSIDFKFICASKIIYQMRILTHGYSVNYLKEHGFFFLLGPHLQSYLPLFFTHPITLIHTYPTLLWGLDVPFGMCFWGGSTKIVYTVKRPYRGHVAVHSLQPTVSEEDQFTYSMITKMAKRERQSSVKTKVVDLFCVVCLHKIFNAFNVVLKLTLNFWIPASKERSTSINYFSFF